MPFPHSARTLILDPHDHVLLVNLNWDGLEFDGGLWATPGGGIEEGEDPVQALRRGLIEETGILPEEIGPEIWTKTAHSPAGHWSGQVDHIYLIRTPRFDPVPSLTDTQLKAENIQELRWWSPKELNNHTATFTHESYQSCFIS